MSKTNPTCPDDLTGEKHFSKFSSFSWLLVYEQKLSRNLTENLWAVLPKLPSTVSEVFKGKKLSHQKKFFSSVSDFELMIFGLLAKKLGRFTKTALYVSRGEFQRKKFFELKSIFSISLWIWADDFQDSGEKCRKYHQSCILPVQTNNLPKNCFGEKNSTISDFQGKNLRISVRNCWHDCQTFLLSVQKKLLRKQKLHKRVNSNHFWTLGEKVSNFYLKPPSRALSEQHSTYPEDEFQEKFFWKYIVLRRSRTPSSNFRTFSEKFFVGLSNMHFMFPKSGFGSNLRLISGRHNQGLQAIKCVGLF